MIEFTNQNFEEITSTDKTVLVQYYAEWCGPCQMLKPVLEGLSKEMTDVTFYRVDIESHRELATKAGIQSIPTVVTYKNGAEIGREAGFKPKHLMEAWINSNK